VIVYASDADLQAWTGEDPPANAAPLLRSASLLVARATRNALYRTTPAGLPVDEDLVEALREATCAQAALWADAGINPAVGAAGDQQLVPTAKSIGSGSITYAVNPAVAAARARVAETLCTESVGILLEAGLLTAGVGST